MTDQDQRRDLSKMRTVPLDDATHRRLRLYVHGLREDGDAGVALARVAAEAVNAYIDRQEQPAIGQRRTVDEIAADILTEYMPEIERAKAAIRAEAKAGDPSEGEGELYGQWRKP